MKNSISTDSCGSTVN